jgi:hypothetical protein
LALGTDDDASLQVPWAEVLRVAARERCAPLCWIRSGGFIRRAAPGAVNDSWRAHALAAAQLAERWKDHLAGCLDLLAGNGIEPVVLKGLPLAQRLYGTTTARPLADLDLFIPADGRAVAHRALTDGGWMHCFGDAPGEGVYARCADGSRWLLEVHSSLTDDNLLQHLSIPIPEAETIEVDGIHCRALGGALMPGYLALHLAKHQLPPLLWMVDFHTLWGGLSLRERAAARSAAVHARIGRYLDHAVRRTERLVRAASGDARALRALGISGRRRVEAHNAVRVAALAATPADAARVMGAWLLPRELRGHPRHLIRRTLRRLRLPLVRVLRTTSSDPEGIPPSPSARALSLESPDLLAIVREVVSRGARLWVTVAGTSMVPAIPPGTRVRLAPVPLHALRAGDVVLAELPGGNAVVHRVLVDEKAEGAGSVRLRGDNNNAGDPAILRTAVVALVEAVERDGVLGSVPRCRPAMAVTMRRARARVRTLIAGVS